ncbi:hypothetical protein QFZ71_004876 [Streptomyces sp. V2I9]|nr:hypothetical protein [Streptomyces sp. V2I9]
MAPFVFGHLKIPRKPGGATALTALVSGRLDHHPRQDAVIASGDNVDADRPARNVAADPRSVLPAENHLAEVGQAMQGQVVPAFGRDEPGPTQHTEVAADGGVGEVELTRYVTDGHG